MEPLSSANFLPTDKTSWLAQVQKELKDPSAYETLRWHTDEGFVVEPYYTAEDLGQAPFTDAALGTTQQAQKQLPGWLNAPLYTLTDNDQADNGLLRDALTRGADTLVVALNESVWGDVTVQRLSRLLNGIKLSDNPIFFRLNTGNPADFVTALKTVAPYQLKGGLLTNVGVDMVEATRLTADALQFRTVCASSHDFHNAGATATQELAFTLSTLADSYDTLTDAGLTIDQLISKTILSVSVGTSYFMEIAKLRALRVLFHRFCGYYSPSGNPPGPFIHAQTSSFYDASTTPYTNLLRSTTEAMSAVIGGCDALTVRPYNAIFEQEDVAPGTPGRDREFADRIARNVSVLLKEESYFDKVADSSAGSYYIEILTHQLTEAAWALFLDVEQHGGFRKAFQSGFVAEVIEQAYRAKVEAVQQGRVLVGVTKFRHDELSLPTVNTLPENKDGLLPTRRLAQEFEVFTH
ncbi:MAG: methylmalonyl-CoA mutase [Spirosoma sp.]|nr:methylmalonyl-CoA mutase [Spirosoma sp.]